MFCALPSSSSLKSSFLSPSTGLPARSRTNTLTMTKFVVLLNVVIGPSGCWAAALNARRELRKKNRGADTSGKRFLTETSLAQLTTAQQLVSWLVESVCATGLPGNELIYERELIYEPKTAAAASSIACACLAPTPAAHNSTR